MKKQSFTKVNICAKNQKKFKNVSITQYLQVFLAVPNVFYMHLKSIRKKFVPRIIKVFGLALKFGTRFAKKDLFSACKATNCQFQALF